MADYNNLFNHELLICGTAESPYQTYDEEIKDEQIIGFVKELRDTEIDAIMLCPLAWRRKLWYSEVDRHWQDVAPGIKEPPYGSDIKYYNRAYFRWQRYMLQKKNPVQLSIDAAREINKAVFMSYRMNDIHHLYDENCYTHDKFWSDNPRFRLTDGQHGGFGWKNSYNYIHKEVRDYFYSIFKELIDMYDFDGFELDFMRHSCLFDKKDISAGIPLMTEFVKNLKDLLKDMGKKRNKELKLCIRVPYKYENCLRMGLDIEKWDRLKIIDMVNMSSHFIMDDHYEPEEFKKHIKNAKIYGEMHFVVTLGELDNGFSNNVSKKTGREMYRTYQQNLLKRGCDGLSYFNFDYTRVHYMSEPRRQQVANSEPPFEVLSNVNIDYLKNEPKHYFQRVNQPNQAALEFYVGDDTKNKVFKKAIAKVTTKNKIFNHNIQIKLNGFLLKETMWLGEMFKPQSIELISAYYNTRFFDVPLEAVKEGVNIAEMVNIIDENCQKSLHFDCFELALYTDKPLWE